MAKGHTFQPPTGTRDFYPQEMLRRRYIEKMWRDTSIRHGFEEIDGPTFEHLDLYTVKSGEGIVNELFSFKRAGGEKDYALRPEFTPTLARMYAAKAGGLPKPTKWFAAGPFFRAERPQRGRLREFLQWNCDVIGDESAHSDAELVGCCIGVLASLGLTPSDVRIRYSHRAVLAAGLVRAGITEPSHGWWFNWIDRFDRLEPEVRLRGALDAGFSEQDVRNVEALWSVALDPSEAARAQAEAERRGLDELVEQERAAAQRDLYGPYAGALLRHRDFQQELERVDLSQWCDYDPRIVRGLAYYTGMVFEVHEAGGKERAIAGGGRYDNLIELFGGPPTPAVGFGMGDVVLSLVLQDKGLMPEGAALMDKLSEPPASPRPDIFIIANDQPDSIAAVRPLVASLRRGGETARPLHARHSYKATKNIGKLLQEASASHARFAAILESGSEATLKNLTTGEQTQHVPLDGIAAAVAPLRAMP